jgi:hypothetical protein
MAKGKGKGKSSVKAPKDPKRKGGRNPVGGISAGSGPYK